MPAGVAATIDPDKALLVSYEDGHMASTEVEIVVDGLGNFGD